MYSEDKDICDIKMKSQKESTLPNSPEISKTKFILFIFFKTYFRERYV